MNPNKLIKDIKQSLGIGTFIMTAFTDYDLFERILASARMWFSRIYAHEIYIPRINFTNEMKYNSRVLTFRIPEYIINELKYEGTSIMDVRHLRPAPSDVDPSTGMMYLPNGSTMYPPVSSGGGYGSSFFGSMESKPSYYMQGMSALVGVAQVQAAYDMYRKPIKAKFRAPNMIEFDVRGASPYVDAYELRLKVGHPKNLMSIDEPHYIMMQRLGIYDVQELLWNSELKGLDGLSNGYDNISLKIDDWQNAAQNRIEYIKELEADIVLMEGISTY